MKFVRFFIIVLSIVSHLEMYAEKGDVCVIQGQIDNTPTDTLLFLRISDDFTKQEREDTVATIHGRFQYVLNSSTCRTVYIMAKPHTGERIVGYIRLITIPGSEINITGTINNPRLSGSEFYDTLDSLMHHCSSMSPTERNAYYADYINSHLSSQVSGYLLGLIYDEKMQQSYQNLADEVRNGVLQPFIDSRIAYVQRQAAIKTNRQNISDGKIAPDFTLKGLDGSDVSFSDFRGKYLVLDFWGSWCGWCVKGFPEMKRYYAKYANKLEIIGVDCNDTDEKWKAAVEKHQLPWKHVFVPRSDRQVIESFAVDTFPTKIVISPDGRIVKVFAGETKDFYQFLDEIMNL